MKLRLTPAILNELTAAMAYALRNRANGRMSPPDATYLKIQNACDMAKGGKTGVTIDADEFDVKELKSRAEHNVGAGGLCEENLKRSYECADRAYWLGRQRAYRALLKRLVQG